MEFLNGDSSIVDFMKTFRIDEVSISFILRGVLKELSILHAKGKVHRDVKALNILLTQSGDVKLKEADFEDDPEEEEQEEGPTTLVGTPHWIAPEIIQEIGYDSSADIWSLGITAIELAKGEPPLATTHPIRVLFLIARNDPPVLEGDFSKQFQDFVSLCLNKNPQMRPSANELLNHPFIRTANDTSPLVELIEWENGWKVVEEELLTHGEFSVDEEVPVAEKVSVAEEEEVSVSEKISVVVEDVVNKEQQKILKLEFSGQFRRLRMPFSFTFDQLNETVRLTFPPLRKRPFQISYIDEEKDKILVASELELLSALDCLGEEGPIIRFKIEKSKHQHQPQQAQQPQKQPQQAQQTPPPKPKRLPKHKRKSQTRKTVDAIHHFQALNLPRWMYQDFPFDFSNNFFAKLLAKFLVFQALLFALFPFLFAFPQIVSLVLILLFLSFFLFICRAIAGPVFRYFQKVHNDFRARVREQQQRQQRRQQQQQQQARQAEQQRERARQERLEEAARQEQAALQEKATPLVPRDALNPVRLKALAQLVDMGFDFNVSSDVLETVDNYDVEAALHNLCPAN
eukprot:CAMPEP_0201492776 /NCGR_PEP_ID=MMETSP0151_2-20130828/34711_1 /ASSEMBLY_ACC=CAM_ASM_000257 /TAXON_ID=200890 /ORGANISM="Paramoeba atlantica, Strain 621/1 / CCAP 1560/9" /LENGTH=570 /DNA_ID=CAMNT_0047879793 /DNA_START=75 /DNA_END=1787 /DNA_ORIENTATION=+